MKYISTAALGDTLENLKERKIVSYAELVSEIAAIPAADVRPVVRGHWELSDDRCWHTCSVCGADIDVSVGLLCYVDNEEVCNHNFCPNCGAWMEES